MSLLTDFSAEVRSKFSGREVLCQVQGPMETLEILYLGDPAYVGIRTLGGACWIGNSHYCLFDTPVRQLLRQRCPRERLNGDKA